MTAPVGAAGKSRDWDEHWRGLRGRRIFAGIALVAFVPLWIGLGALGLLIGFVWVFAAYWHLRAWPCPRCQQPIVGARFSTFPMRCVSCDLPIFGHVIDIEQPATMDPRAFQLPNGRRRFVAWYQIVSGAGLMCLSVFAHAPWWQLLLMEGLAAMSLTAGVWLLHDDMRGYALTRRLQWVQLVQLQSSWLTYVAMSGVGIELNDVNGSIGISPGIMSKVILEIMPGQTFGVAVNLWAALLLLVLLQARPAQSASLTAPVHDESLAGAAQMTSGDAMKVPLAAEADAEPFRAAEAAIVNSMSRQGYVHIRTALLICRLRASDARRRLDIYRA